jgi:hypothetical protein
MTLSAPHRPAAAALARAGLLGVYTVVARREARRPLDASGPCEIGLALQSEAFGFRATIPDGRRDTSEESLRISSYGEMRLLDVEVATLGGSRASILAVVEPAVPTPGSIELAVRAFALTSGGETVFCEEGAGPGETREMTVTREDGEMIAYRVFLVGRRVVCAMVSFRPTDADAHRGLRSFLRDFEVDPEPGKASRKRPSGAYVAIGKDRR